MSRHLDPEARDGRLLRLRMGGNDSGMASLRVVVAKNVWHWKALFVVAVIIGGLGAHTLFHDSDLSAAGGGPVAFVDVSRLIDDYLAPVVDGPLTAETLRLQAEFEEMARELDEDEAQDAFNRYQAMLNLVKHDLIDEQLPTINAAIGVVAEREAITVVLDKQSVLHGGVDLTELVLNYLREKDG